MSKKPLSNVSLLSLRLLPGLVAAGLLFFMIHSSLMAQATLVNANPSDNQIFKEAIPPSRVTLTFSEAVKPEGSTLNVVDAVRNRIDRGNVAINDKTISIELNQGIVPALYSVEYSVISAVDGKVTTGSYNFQVVPPAGNPLDAGYLFSTPTNGFGNDWNVYFPWALVFFVVFLVGAALSNYVYFIGKYRYRNNLLNYTMVNRGSRNAAIAFSLGVFFVLCRLGNLQPFNVRLWMYLAFLLLVYYMVRGALWRFRVYPKAKAAWLENLGRSRRRTPEPVGAVQSSKASVPSKAPLSKSVPTGAIASGSGDAGGEEKLNTSTVRENVSPAGQSSTESIRSISQRGQKRREKKRDRR